MSTRAKPNPTRWDVSCMFLRRGTDWWRYGHRPPREWVVTSLRRCVCWPDLWKLAKWMLVDRILRYIAGSRYCWADLCMWSWQDWCEIDRTLSGCRYGAGRCQQEARRDGRCYCGQFQFPTVEVRS